MAGSGLGVPPLTRPDEAAGRSSSSDPQPHHDLLGAGPRRHDLRHLRQDVLAGIGAADPPGEVGQHLVRGGPPAVHDPVGQPPGPLVRTGWNATATTAAASAASSGLCRLPASVPDADDQRRRRRR